MALANLFTRRTLPALAVLSMAGMYLGLKSRSVMLKRAQKEPQTSNAGEEGAAAGLRGVAEDAAREVGSLTRGRGRGGRGEDYTVSTQRSGMSVFLHILAS
ncbi:hypothetical protein MMC24_000056 [Lignoscripta atroalba]|nr:hypothetical protein [Lignoscripta atroalba]